VEEVRKREEHERSDFSLTSLSQNVEKDDDNAEAFRKLTTQLSQEEIVSMREECVFRTMSDTHSGRFRTAFRTKPDTIPEDSGQDSGDSGHHSGDSGQ